jgi:hypothetical protein
MMPTTQRLKTSKPAKTAKVAREAQPSETTPSPEVEAMLRDIGLVLWLTRRVKDEILADAAPQRGALNADQPEVLTTTH